MDDIKNLILEVLRDGYVMNLGTNDDQGPWVAILVYIFDQDLNLYWVSKPLSRHSRALTLNPKVACTIIANHSTNKERALQIEGLARLLPDRSLQREQQLQKKRNLPQPTKAGEILTGNLHWYKLKPTKIELIHNELFGYERKSLDLT